MNEKLRNGWTAFGDDHLFIPEADFHRAVILHIATQSVREVLERARRVDGKQQELLCRMCDANLFPIPKDPDLLPADWKEVRKNQLTEKEYPLGSLVKFEPVHSLSTETRSLDPRVPGAPIEGWKLGLGFTRRGLRTEGGIDSGVLIRLDYLRNVAPQAPNSWGFEYWNVANLGQSYLLSMGYSRPRELSPFALALRAKLGWRIDENLTPSNPAGERRNKGELIFPSIELTYELYKPVAVFYQWNYQLRDIHGGFKRSDYKGGAAAGLRIDLSGV